MLTSKVEIGIFAVSISDNKKTQFTFNLLVPLFIKEMLEWTIKSV